MRATTSKPVPGRARRRSQGFSALRGPGSSLEGPSVRAPGTARIPLNTWRVHPILGSMSLPIPDSISSPEFKYRMPVQLSVAGGPEVAGWVSLSRRSEFRSGPQTLLERLNERVRVLPVVEGELTHLVSRALIEWAEPGSEVEVGLVGPAPFAVTKEEHARVRLRSGHVLEGTIAMEMPAGYNRTSDFINGEDDFFALRCGTRSLLVNKRRVRDIRLVAERGTAAH